jgi:hypothetical protein
LKNFTFTPRLIKPGLKYPENIYPFIKFPEFFREISPKANLLRYEKDLQYPQ